MPGLRIYHPEARSAVVLVPIPPKTITGAAKEVQIVVDDTGHAIVSEGVWAELQFALSVGVTAGFIILNEVPNPPAQRVDMSGTPDTGRRTFRVEQAALREIAPAGVHTRVVSRGF